MEINSSNSGHLDVIHDIEYDFYGTRFATCSSDQTIKVWEQDDKDNWFVSCTWKAHSGSIFRINWAHPEFGQVLAACSFDRTASVWEELIGEKSPSAPVKRWVRKTNLVDSRTSVTDVKFGPNSQGLVLATCSSDGIIRIYEAPDIMNLSQWTLQHEISCKLPLSCISWNPSSSFRLHAPMIAAGSDVTQSSEPKVNIFEYSEITRRWTKTETIAITEPVHDIAFAPNVGRSYHVLAVASKDVSIFNLNPVLGNTSNGSRFDVQPVHNQQSEHFSTVWRLTWNITGTMLASTADDGFVRIWKMNYQRHWKCVCSFKPENSQGVEIPTANVAINQLNTTVKYFKKTGTSNQINLH